MYDQPDGIPRDVPGLWQLHRDWLASHGVIAPKVVIHGGYGKNNLGDDAILHVLLARVRRELPRARITVVCHGPENVARRYGEITELNTCHFKSLAALRAVLESHIYIIGGGGIINRINTYSGRDTLRLFDMKGKVLFLAALLAKLCGAQTHFYAIGANSFPDRGVRFLARHVLRTADVVSVRDRLSVNNIQPLVAPKPLCLVLDPALSMEAAAPEAGERLLERWGYRRTQRPLVCIGFRYERNPLVDDAAKIKIISWLVKYLIEQRGADVVFIPASQHPSQHYEDDLHLGRALRAVLGAEKHFFLVEEYTHPTVTMAAFGQADLCIFERLHAVILSTVVKAPVFAIAYDSKVSEFMLLLGRSEDLLTTEQFLSAPGYGWLDRMWSSAIARRAERWGDIATAAAFPGSAPGASS